MRLFTGDECGLLKECIPELSTNNSQQDDRSKPLPPNGAMTPVTREGVCRVDPKELQTRSRSVIDMAFTNSNSNGDGETDQVTFAALRLDGSIELWEGSTENNKSFGNYHKKITTLNVFESSKESNGETKGRPLGLGTFQKHNRLCAGDMFGNVAVLKSDGGDIVQHYNAYTTSKRGNTISYTPGKHVNNQLATSFCCDDIHGRVAVGGRERETTLLDLESGKVVFKAKNLPPDPQTLLQQPVWPSSILFLGESSNNVMAVGTGYKQVRIYDVREDSKTRRPTATTPEQLLEYRVTSLCQTDPYNIVVGDTAGYILSLDIRKLGRNPKIKATNDLGRYVGPGGSVRQLMKHPTLPRLAAVGLDRMLRIYDTDKRKQLSCVYLKQRLNCVLFGKDETWGATDDDGNPGEMEDADDWDIDQDDVVKDYVDSDEEEGDDDQCNKKQGRDQDLEQGGSSNASEEDGDDDDSEDDDDDSEDDDDDDSEDNDDDDGDEKDDSEDHESDESDEEVIISLPPKKKKRHH
jgi:ribosome biogenesis protein NSA1